MFPHSVFITNKYEYEANNKLTGKPSVVESLHFGWLLLCHSGLHQPGKILLSAHQTCMRTRNESLDSEYAVFKVYPKLQCEYDILLKVASHLITK